MFILFVLLHLCTLRIITTNQVGVIQNFSLIASSHVVVATTCHECICTMFTNSSMFALNCFAINGSCQLFSNYSISFVYSIESNANSTFYFLRLPPISNITTQTVASIIATNQDTLGSLFTTASQPDSSASRTTTTITNAVIIGLTPNSAISTAAPMNAMPTNNATCSTAAPDLTICGTVSASTNDYYCGEGVTLNLSTTLTNVTIVITVQKTVNATYRGLYNSFSGGTLDQSYVDNGTQIIYTWSIVNGQTIAPSGSLYTAEAQFNLVGTYQPTSDDTYIVTFTTSTNQTNTLSGHF